MQSSEFSASELCKLIVELFLILTGNDWINHRTMRVELKDMFIYRPNNSVAILNLVLVTV